MRNERSFSGPNSTVLQYRWACCGIRHQLLACSRYTVYCQVSAARPPAFLTPGVLHVLLVHLTHRCHQQAKLTNYESAAPFYTLPPISVHPARHFGKASSSPIPTPTNPPTQPASRGMAPHSTTRISGMLLRSVAQLRISRCWCCKSPVLMPAAICKVTAQ